MSEGGSGQEAKNYDGRTVYLPCVEEIRAGDILLSFNAESDKGEVKQARLITAVTGGTFSHAAICSSPPVFIEAIGSGVSTISLSRCFAHDIANVRVLRLPDEATARRAARMVQDEIGRDYSKTRAIRSVFPSEMLERISDNGIFCSALVAQAFISAGAELFTTPADRTTPATIEQMAGLEDITKLCFRPGLAPRNAETMCALDGHRNVGLSQQQTVISARCAQALWPTAETIAATFRMLDLAPTPTMYGLLRFVVLAVERRDEVPEWQRSVFDTALADLDEQLAAFIDQGELKALLVGITAEDDAMIQRTIAESFQAHADIDLDAMEGYLVAGRIQLADRQSGIANWEEWDLSRSRAMRSYIQIDRDAAEATRLRNIALVEILERRGRKMAA